jgi:hypothetical protein
VGISNPGIIFEDIMRVNYTEIIDGIRLISRENSVASGQIVGGGVGFNFVHIRVASVASYLHCAIDSFRNGTLMTTTPAPDYYVQHWGTVHSDSVLMSK